jgi:hypothetical protein
MNKDTQFATRSKGALAVGFTAGAGRGSLFLGTLIFPIILGRLTSLNYLAPHASAQNHVF